MAVKEIIVAKIGYSNLLAIGVVASSVSSFEKKSEEYPYPGILFDAKNSEGEDVVFFVLMLEEDLFWVIWSLVYSCVFHRKEDVTSAVLGKVIRDILGR